MSLLLVVENTCERWYNQIMAYSGYLIKALGVNGGSDYILPMHFIIEKTYKMTYSVIDFDSTRNGAGKLVRNALKHKVPHCTVNIKPLSNTNMAALWTNLQSRYTINKEKKIRLSVYIPEIDGYVTENFYIPDMELTIRRIEEGTNKIVYEGFTLEFIGY